MSLPLSGVFGTTGGGSGGVVADDSITFSKIQDIGTGTVIGRSTAGTGDPESITVNAPLTIAALALDFDETVTLGNNARVAVSKNSGATVGTRREINFIEGANVTLTIADDSGNEEIDVTIAATGAAGAPSTIDYVVGTADAGLSAELVATDTATIDFVIGAGLATWDVKANSIVNTLLRDSAGFSVIGKGSTGTGDPADIVAADETVLGRTAAGNVAFSALATGQITNAAVTAVKLVNSGVFTGDATTTFPALTIANDAITYAKMQNVAGFSVVGKSTTGSGDAADITAADETVLGRTAVGNLVFAALATGQIAADAVTYAKIQNVSATDKVLGRSTAGAGDIEEIECTSFGRALIDDASVNAQRATLGVKFTHAVTIETPTAAEDVSFFHSDVAITITKMVAVLVGSATPSVTWTARQGTDRSATGTEVVTGGTTTTSVTTGSVVTSFNDATVPANSFLWIETTAQSGTVNSINITITYTID